MVLSSDTETMILAQALYATAFTAPVCPSKVDKTGDQLSPLVVSSAGGCTESIAAALATRLLRGESTAN